MSVLEVALDPSTGIFAVDPGKAFNRVRISNGSGLLADPMSLSVSRDGIAQLELALNKHGPDEPVIRSRRPAAWIGRESPNRSDAIPVQCDSSRLRRRNLFVHGWVRAGSSPTIAIEGVDAHSLPTRRSTLWPGVAGRGTTCRGAASSRVDS